MIAYALSCLGACICIRALDLARGHAVKRCPCPRSIKQLTPHTLGIVLTATSRPLHRQARAERNVSGRRREGCALANQSPPVEAGCRRGLVHPARMAPAAHAPAFVHRKPDLRADSRRATQSKPNRQRIGAKAGPYMRL